VKKPSRERGVKGIRDSILNYNLSFTMGLNKI